MLNFIIGEDNPKFAQNLGQLISKNMMPMDFDYFPPQIFSGYGEDFRKAAEEERGFKVYFLDIRTDNGNGMDAARMIREELDDWNSIIIMVTSYTQYRFEVLGSRLYIMDFISKLEDVEARVTEVLQKVMKHYDNRGKSLKYEYESIIKRIDFAQIVYIEKVPKSKLSRVRTTYGESPIAKPLIKVYKMLDERFLKVHRSLIVNLDFISEYDINENRILFKNGETSYSISREMKKELKKRVGTWR